MKNREKFAKEILDVACTGKGIAVSVFDHVCACSDIACMECKFYLSDCAERIKEWADSEYIEKNKISESDRRFLDYLPDRFGWMARDLNGSLCVYTSETVPQRGTCNWHQSSCTYRPLDYKIEFPMIKWSDTKPWSIEDLKKLEVEP